MSVNRFALLLCLVPVFGYSQHTGTVRNSRSERLPGVSVHIPGTAFQTTTDSLGNYQFGSSEISLDLVFYLAGYRIDTIRSVQNIPQDIVLEGSTELGTQVVESRGTGTSISHLNPIQTETIGTQELYRAACCNVSESFVNNGTIDVNTTDVVTGSRQLQMLGLQGVYLQNTVENLPVVRGLGVNQGLGFLPGSWVDRIQISKGVGSVANGFESITGQLNTELKKPDCNEKRFVNLYQNHYGRYEANYLENVEFANGLQTKFLGHANYMNAMIDQNKDGFMDNPDGWQANLMNRWLYRGAKGWTSQAVFRYVKDYKHSGTTHDGENALLDHHYRYVQETEQYDLMLKSGYVFAGKPDKSIGFLAHATQYKTRATFDFRWYDALQRSANAHVFYQNTFGKKRNHQFRTGLNAWADHYTEYYQGTPFLRTEITAGGFLESTLNWGKSTLVAGIRGDHNFLFGGFATPRLHYKLQLAENLQWRISGGRGQRTANVIAENLGYLVSSRNLHLPAVAPGSISSAYDLRPEVAWNSGSSLQWDFSLGGRDGSLNAEYYYTWFERQTVIDLDAEAQKMVLYNMDRKAYAGSFQVDYNQAIGRRFDLRLSYRNTDAWMYYQTAEWLEKPFTSRHRGLATLAFHSRENKWTADFTVNYVGSKRMPSTLSNPTAYRFAERSPDYALLHVQVSRNWEDMALYLGVENLSGVIQSYQIISPEDPHSGYFDAAQIWGPTFKQAIYLGFRWRLNRRSQE